MLADRLWGNCDWSMQMTMLKEHVLGNKKCALELEKIESHFPLPIVSLPLSFLNMIIFSEPQK